MPAWQSVVNVAGHHLIPCLLASASIFVVLWLLFELGGVRRPADRVLFLYGAHLKAALAVWLGEAISCLAANPRYFGYFHVRLPDVGPRIAPGEHLLTSQELAVFLAGSRLAGWVLVGAAATAGALLLYRWARIAPVYRSVYESRRAEPQHLAELQRIFDELVEQIHIGRRSLRPTLMVIRDAPCPAFTVGIRQPIVVLSAEMSEQLGWREVKGVLAHELAHVRRLDYLGRWLATIIGDLLIWNPFVTVWYNQLVDEQEKACDEYAARALGDPAAVASGLVEVAAFAHRFHPVTIGPLTAWRAGRGLNSLHERLDLLAGVSSLPGARPRRWAFAVYPLLVAFMSAQPHVVLALPNLYLAAAGIL